MKSFSAQVDAWARKAHGRSEAVFKTAVQNTFDLAQVPVASGGRMRIDTGFLRASFAASLDGIPSGPSRQGEAKGNPDDVALTIARLNIGDTIYAGWTANYAAAREAKDGFREAAVQRWPITVAEAAAEAKRRIP